MRARPLFFATVLLVVYALFAFPWLFVKAWLDVIKAWCSDRMAPYKVPRLVKVVDAVPKNAMGKVNKKQLKLAFGE
jgi:acyl-CoA synthetase (AMP-forming)/AMP-acid ligase II